MNLQRIGDELESLLHRGRELVNGQVQVVRLDDNPQTNLDTRTDAYLRDHLTRIVDAPIISEEDERPSSNRSGLCWVLDPIDGTINAIAGTDEFAISVALIEAYDLKPIVGAVYLPRPGILYRATSGLAAFRDGHRLPAAAPAPEGKRIVSFGVPKDIPGIAARMSGAFHRILTAGWVTRQSGSASIDICRVAAGSWSAFFEFRLMYWDFVAAAMIAREAGCHTLLVPRESVGTEDLPLEYDVLVARSEAICDEIADAVGIGPSTASS